VAVVVRVDVSNCVLWTVDVTVNGTNTTVVRVGIVLVEVEVLV
jgi:hypothetical protein